MSIRDQLNTFDQLLTRILLQFFDILDGILNTSRHDEAVNTLLCYYYALIFICPKFTWLENMYSASLQSRNLTNRCAMNLLSFLSAHIQSRYDLTCRFATLSQKSILDTSRRDKAVNSLHVNYIALHLLRRKSIWLENMMLPSLQSRNLTNRWAVNVHSFPSVYIQSRYDLVCHFRF